MSRQIVVIGAVALGPKAACRFKRLEPESRVIMLDQSEFISYGGCGIPYYVSGDISDASELQATSFHMIRDPEFFQEAKGVEVRTRTRVLGIHREDKQLLVHDLGRDQKYYLEYDQLVLATGSRANKPPIPGVDLPGVHPVTSLDQAIEVKNQIAGGEVNRAVVIGAGLIGLEMAEALTDLWGVETSVVEMAPQVLPGFVSSTLAGMVQRVMRDNEVAFYTREQVLEISGRDRVQKVKTDQRELEADMVVLAAGVQPNSELAQEAGLEVSSQGAVVVDKYLRTSDPSIFAGGDCVQTENLVTGGPGYFPMGSMANRQGRVIGTNLAGGEDVFPGAAGCFIVKTFDHAVAGVGLSPEAARNQGYDVTSALVAQFDKSHFYPEKDMLHLELAVESSTGRVLGMQGVCSNGESLKSRVDAVSSILPYKPTTKDLSNLEVSYSPPFGSAMDALNNLGNTAENILQGWNRGVGPEEFARMWEERGSRNLVFMDCRGADNALPLVEKYPDKWVHVQNETLEDNLDQVPRAETLVLVCNSGGRSYEAQLKLARRGITNTLNLHGGMAMLKKWGMEL